MSKTVRITTLLLSVLLMAALLAACTTPATTTTAATTKASTTAGSTAAPTTTEPPLLEITYLGWNPNNIMPVQDNPTQKMLEEKYNIKLTLAQVDQFTLDSWNLYWASGKTADYISINGAETRLYPLIQQGLVRSIDDKVMEQYLPTWLEMARDTVPADMEKKQCSFSGVRYVVPMINYASKLSYIGVTRKDWLTKVGITKAPATIDEFENMLKLFTTGDPDGNGKNDTVGLESEPWNKFNYVFGAYNTAFGAYWADAGNKVFYTSATQEYRECLKKLNAWYKAGYIDKEFVTDARAAVWSKFVDGKIGTIFEHTTWCISSQTAGPAALFAQKNPGIELVYYGAFTGPDGKTAGALSGYPNVANNGFAFGKNTSDEKMIRIMQMMNDRCKDVDLYNTLQYGTLGKTYDLVNNIPVLKPETNTGTKMAELGLGQYFGMMPLSMPYFQKYMMLPADKTLFDLGAANKKVYMAGACFVTTGVNQSFVTSGTPVGTKALEYYYNFITGAADLDKDWDKYIAELNAAGLDKILAEYNTLIAK